MLTWMTNEIMRLGEFNRVQRLLLGTIKEDLDTNSMSDMFPGQYQFFYDREMLKDFLPRMPPGVVLDIVTNSESMVNTLVITKPGTVVKPDVHSGLADCNDSLTYDSFAMIDCATTKFFSAEDILPSTRVASWVSPLRSNVRLIEELLQKISFLMGEPEAHFSGAVTNFGVNVVLRLPMRYSPLILDRLMFIHRHPMHKVQFVYPKKMHDPYFTLVVRKIHYRDPKQGIVIGLARYLKRQEDSLTVFLHMLQHFTMGVTLRHDLWNSAVGSVTRHWTAERFKHLVHLGFNFSAQLEGTITRRALVVKRLVGRVSNTDKNKAYKKAMKKKTIEQAMKLKEAMLKNQGPVTRSLTRNVARVN